jgi:putative salt-induced outer membrane protein YdiY
MKKWWISVIILLAHAYILISPVMADQILLVNGDRITGKLVRMEGNQVIFKTDYAGEISIAWDKVNRIETDTPMNVILSDGEARSVSDIKMGDEAFTTSDITAINPKPKPKVKITTRANAGLENERGNTDTDKIYGDAEFTARTKKDRYTVGGEVNQEKADGIDTARNWLAYGDYNRFITDKLFFYADALFENDEFADLDLRTTLGAGLGYQIFESEELNLSVGGGLGYVSENFILAEDDDFSSGQWRIDYDQYLFKKIVQLFHRQRGFISLEDTNNWKIRTRQGLRFPLYKGITATLQYNYDYYNDPSPAAISKWDSKFLFLIGYQFKN